MKEIQRLLSKAPFRWVHGSPVFRPEKLLGGGFDFGALPFFTYGRYGLIYSLKYLRAKRVLVPDYMCHEVLHSLREFGFAIDFYAMTPDLELDLEDIAQKLKQAGRSSALLIFHPYGRMLRGLDQVGKITQERAVPVIEDCAHLPFPFRFQSGLAAKAAVYTLRKSYAIPYGAVVDFGEENDSFSAQIDSFHPVQDRAFGTLKWILRQTAKRLVMALGIRQERKYHDLSSDPLQAESLPSRWAGKLLPSSEPERAVRVRRENYARFRERFGLFDGWATPMKLDEKRDVPYQLLLVLRPGLDLETVIGFFLKHGISAVKGLALDPDVLSALPADSPFNRQIALPIHQDLGSAELDHVFAVLQIAQQIFSNCPPRVL